MARGDINTRTAGPPVREQHPETHPAPKPRHAVVRASMQKSVYLVNARMILEEMWRKKMEAMKESERTRTMKGSLWGKRVKIGAWCDEHGTHTRRPGESSV